MSFLDQVRREKEAEIVALKFGPRPERPAGDAVRPFGVSLRHSGGVIAEVKGTSPSQPDFHNSVAPATLATWYQRGGAVAMSVVTDQKNFGTSLADLAAMRRATSLPVISKDFIIDPIQIRVAWAAGADAVLLIARMLEQAQLTEFLTTVHDLGLDALVECHDAADITKSLIAGARIVGINNRDLAALTTDIAKTENLLPLVPDSVVRVSESGLQGRADITRLTARGVDAFLVGHALLLSGDPGRKLRELNGRAAEDRVRVKICGLTRPQDAVHCHDQGADLLGVIFAPSPRQASAAQAVAIRAVVPEARLVGVFVDEDLDVVADLTSSCQLDLVQLHGQETPDYCRKLAALTGLPLIKAMTPAAVGVGTVQEYDAVKYFLLDQPKTENEATPVGGPTWRQAAASLTSQGAELMLAGGLDAGLSAEIAGSWHPFAIDVCRVVESGPGRKDHGRVTRFLQEVKR